MRTIRRTSCKMRSSARLNTISRRYRSGNGRISHQRFPPRPAFAGYDKRCHTEPSSNQQFLDAGDSPAGAGETGGARREVLELNASLSSLSGSWAPPAQSSCKKDPACGGYVRSVFRIQTTSLTPATMRLSMALAPASISMGPPNTRALRHRSGGH